MTKPKLTKPTNKPRKRGRTRQAGPPMAADEARQGIMAAAKEGVEIVAARAPSIQDTTIGIVHRAILEDVASHALAIGKAEFPAIMANCRFATMAAYQLGRLNQNVDFKPGEAVPVLIRTIVNMPEEDQERGIKIAASLAATAVSKTLEPQSRYSSARVHVWVAYLFGRDRGFMDRGAS